MTQLVIEGTVAFSNVREHEFYKGQDTGRYTLVCTLDDSAASKLADLGVKLKTYEGKQQRKFASKFHIPVVDSQDEPVEQEIPYGSKVRLLVQTGNEHPVHGTATYLDRVRVLEFAETGEDSHVPTDF